MFDHYLKRRLKTGECFLGHILNPLTFQNVLTLLNSAKLAAFICFIFAKLDQKKQPTLKK